MKEIQDQSGNAFQVWGHQKDSQETIAQSVPDPDQQIRHAEWLKARADAPEDLLISPAIQAAIVCRSDLRKRIRDLRGTGRTLKILQSDLRPGFPYDDPHELEWRLNQFLLGSGLRFKRTELHHNPAWKLCRE